MEIFEKRDNMAGKTSDVTGTQIGDNNHLTIPIHLGMDGSDQSLSVRDGGLKLVQSGSMGHPPQIVINVYQVNSQQQQQPVLSEDTGAHRTIPPDRRAVSKVNRKRKLAAIEGADAVVPCKKAKR